MQNDRKLLWIVEYIIGIVLLAAVMPFVIHPQTGWSRAHGWAYLLFITCAGISILSSASGARHLMKLSERIKKLEQIIDSQKSGGQDMQTDSGQKHTTSEHFVGSVN